MVLALGRDVTWSSPLELRDMELRGCVRFRSVWLVRLCLGADIRAVYQETFNLETPEAEIEASGVYGLMPVEEPCQV